MEKKMEKYKKIKETYGNKNRYTKMEKKKKSERNTVKSSGKNTEKNKKKKYP